LQDPIKQPLLKRLAGQEELAQLATQTFLDILLAINATVQNTILAKLSIYDFFEF